MCKKDYHNISLVSAIFPYLHFVVFRGIIFAVAGAILSCLMSPPLDESVRFMHQEMESAKRETSNKMCPGFSKKDDMLSPAMLHTLPDRRKAGSKIEKW